MPMQRPQHRHSLLGQRGDVFLALFHALGRYPPERRI